ncbi:ATP-binding protein [Couchioplanes azureus]|uniref:ATP-binding protein n=1 Tax=Couchioplanes caeruleus TaxID=56438 RepID=UPI00166FB16B|nr:ATP-binding protein [Couchioplanes caeruleus]
MNRPRSGGNDNPPAREVPGAQPPYLFVRRDALHTGVDVTMDMESSMVTFAVHGTWEPRLRHKTYAALVKCLSEHPVTLLIDLRDLTDPYAASVATWITARRLGDGMEPPVQILACVPPGAAVAARLQRLGAARFLPVYPTIERARTAAGQRPLTDRLVVHLHPSARAPARARAAVTDACAAWQLPELHDRARMVVSELVSNAVQHAGTAITVILSRRGSGMHLAVGDDDPGLPRLCDTFPAPLDVLPYQRGLELHIVHAAATLWGATPTASGKVVWATVGPRTGRHDHRLPTGPVHDASAARRTSDR